MRIAKYISHSGYCSRRDAEKLILSGKVYINNNLCIKPNVNVNIKDKIFINKKLITLEKKIRLWKFYKPIKIICTNKDPSKRKTLFEILPKNFSKLISIGRLDFMSEGLILLTNNGDFARKLELPTSNLKRVYKLHIKGNVSINMINKINKGISIKGIFYGKVQVKLHSKNLLIFTLYEGKNREIRNICNNFNWKITKLIRTQYGDIKLDTLKPQEIIEIKKFSNLC